MGIYSLIYYNLCQSKSQLKESWKPGSDLHRHHIIPKHSGGIDDDSNYTYLTIREHIIAHFLLWKIHKDPNDLRSMKMLGANLTYEQRRIVGLWCKENKIGYHDPIVRKEAQQKGLDSQKQKNTEDTFYYWSTKEGRRRRASMGGKASMKSPNSTWAYWSSKEGQKKRASLGGQTHKGKRCMYKPGDKTFKKVRSEDIQSYLNEGYIFGFPYPTKNQYSSSDI